MKCPHGKTMPSRCDACERVAKASYPRTYAALQQFKRTTSNLHLTVRQAVALQRLVLAALDEGASRERGHWQSVVAAIGLPRRP